jgi:hypothetical protein
MNPRRLLEELASRAAKPRFDIEKWCGGHVGQLAVARCRHPRQHWMWARQTGKSQVADAVMAENAERFPRSTNILLHLTGTAVEMANWFPVWKGQIAPIAGVPDDWHNETERVTYYPNGSRVCFSGTDDMKNIRRWLGNRLHNGIIIIDESQDQPPEVLKYILNQLLPPMLTPTTRVITAGVLPDVPAGLFYETAHPQELNGGACTCKGIRHFEYARAANIHTPGAVEQEIARLLELGIDPEKDPQFLRDFYLKRVWNLTATAYRYDRERNGYKAETPEWLDTIDWEHGVAHAAVPHERIDNFTVGIDPGGGDRTSIVIWGWGEHTHEIQHVFEWVTPRDTPVPLSEIASTVAAALEHYPTDDIYWDPGSGSLEIDTFGTDYGIPLIRAANKTDFPGQIRRVNDLLTKGWLRVMIGSAVEEDYQRARLDMTARARGQFRWSSQWHPDPSEAGRYGLQGYWASYTEPKAPQPIEVQKRERWAKKMRKLDAVARGTRDVEDDEATLVEGLFAGLLDD